MYMCLREGGWMDVHVSIDLLTVSLPYSEAVWQTCTYRVVDIVESHTPSKLTFNLSHISASR